MKYDIELKYTTETGVEVSVQAAIDGVVIHTKDGDHVNHVTVTENDAVELSNMLARASQHTREMNKRN